MLPADRLVKFIRVPIRPDYFGFAFSSLREERHIKFMGKLRLPVP